MEQCRGYTSPFVLATVTALLSGPLVAQNEVPPAPADRLIDDYTEGEAIGPQPGQQRTLPAMQNPYTPDDEEALSDGRRLYMWFNCYGCHGGHGGGGMGPSLRDGDWRYGSTSQEIFNSIADGRAQGMPAWGTKLPADQIWKMVTYINSLRTEYEPEPPQPNPSYSEQPPPGRKVQNKREKLSPEQ